jgi:hypothetical protein
MKKEKRSEFEVTGCSKTLKLTENVIQESWTFPSPANKSIISVLTMYVVGVVD